MPDQLLLLIGNWLIVKAEGTTAILVVGIIAACAALVLLSSPYSRKFFHSANLNANDDSNIDQRR